MDLLGSIGGGNRGFVEEYYCVSRVLEEGCFWGLQISLSGVLFATLIWPVSYSPRHLTDAAALPVEFWRKPFSRRSAQVTQIASGRRSPRVLELCVRNGALCG